MCYIKVFFKGSRNPWVCKTFKCIPHIFGSCSMVWEVKLVLRTLKSPQTLQCMDLGRANFHSSPCILALLLRVGYPLNNPWFLIHQNNYNKVSLQKSISWKQNSFYHNIKIGYNSNSSSYMKECLLSSLL